MSPENDPNPGDAERRSPGTDQRAETGQPAPATDAESGQSDDAALSRDAASTAGASDPATADSAGPQAGASAPATAASAGTQGEASSAGREPCEGLPSSVVLVGPPGAGKSTIGRKLARELGLDLYDTDAGIEEETGRTIPEIFAEDGEPEFRRIEEEVVRAAVLNRQGVISLGGGSVLSAATREVLRGRTVIYLEISVGEGLRRTGASTNRPLLNGDDPAKKYRELMKIRRPLYREVASIRVRTDGRSPGRVVRMILAKLGVEPTVRLDDPATEPAPIPNGSAGSRSRRRRRRGRGRGDQAAPANSTAAVSIPDSTAEATDDSAESPAAEGAKRSRRSRRSRRRGRRNSDAPAVTTSPGATGSGSGTTKPATGTDFGSATTRSDTSSAAASSDASPTATPSGGANAGATPSGGMNAGATPSGGVNAGTTPTGDTGGRARSTGGGRSARRRRAARAAGAPDDQRTTNAGTNRTAAHSATETTGASGSGQRDSAPTGPGRPDSDAAQADSGPGAAAAPGAGRSRRARARRARARARQPDTTGNSTPTATATAPTSGEAPA